jgi:UDP-GlcNAc:undecaprenyl-phosphate GlcNAc-1-phosphate transferase
MAQYFFVFLYSFIATLILVKVALKVFPKIGFMDKPKKYGLKRKPIPYIGGLVLFLVFVFGVLIFLPVDVKVISLLIGVFLIAGISFLDDLFDVSPWIRLMIQVLASIIIVYAGIGILSITNPFGGVIELGIFAGVFTIIWIMLVVNVMNFLDGVNGLVSGVGAIASITIFALSIRPENLIDQTSWISYFRCFLGDN